MSYTANVVKVMIASPGDVATERQNIREAVYEWNAVHSEDREIVLLPIGWETHSSPSMEGRAQDVINKQILDGCDLLVAVFWTRLGSPTGKAASGTVEEINEHLGAGKPAMLYFSSAPVRMDSVDDAQYKALLEFKADCRERGLVEEYDSISQFREKFTRQLAQTVIREFPADVARGVMVNGEIELSQGIEAAGSEKTSIANRLSESAKTLLKEAAQDNAGQVIRTRTSSGFSVQTNGRNLVESSEPRTEAKWQSALEELCDIDLLEDRGSSGEVFAVTNLGYEVADRLPDSA